MIFVGLKSILSETRIATPAYFALHLFPPFLYFEPMCVLACEMGFLDTAHQWVLMFYPICQSVSFVGVFNQFTFKGNIVMCEFDHAILMIAGFFAC